MPFKQQFAQLSDSQAKQYDEDNKAMMRLRMRGYLTDGVQKAIINKIGKALEKELKAL